MACTSLTQRSNLKSEKQLENNKSVYEYSRRFPGCITCYGALTTLRGVDLSSFISARDN